MELKAKEIAYLEISDRGKKDIVPSWLKQDGPDECAL